MWRDSLYDGCRCPAPSNIENWIKRANNVAALGHALCEQRTLQLSKPSRDAHHSATLQTPTGFTKFQSFYRREVLISLRLLILTVVFHCVGAYWYCRISLLNICNVFYHFRVVFAYPHSGQNFVRHSGLSAFRAAPVLGTCASRLAPS